MDDLLKILYPVTLLLLSSASLMILVYLWREKGVLQNIKERYIEVIQDNTRITKAFGAHEQSFNNMRTIVLGYKAAFQADTKELQIKVEQLYREQKRLNKNQLYLKDKMIPNKVEITLKNKKMLEKVKSQLKELS